MSFRLSSCKLRLPAAAGFDFDLYQPYLNLAIGKVLGTEWGLILISSNFNRIIKGLCETYLGIKTFL